MLYIAFAVTRAVVVGIAFRPASILDAGIGERIVSTAARPVAVAVIVPHPKLSSGACLIRLYAIHVVIRSRQLALFPNTCIDIAITTVLEIFMFASACFQITCVNAVRIMVVAIVVRIAGRPADIFHAVRIS